MPEPFVPRLIVRHGSDAPFEVRVTRFPFRVGREPDNDLRLNDSAVSGHHFRLRREGDTVYLEDLDSSNGTFLDQDLARVKSVALKDRSRITVGRETRMSFRLEEPPEQTTTQKIQPSVILNGFQAMSQRVTEMVAELDTLPPGAAQVASPPGEFLSLSMEAKSVIDQGAQAYARLAALYDATGHIIAGFENLEECLNKVLDTALGVLQAERGFVMLREGPTGALAVKAARDVDLGTPEEQGSMGIAERVAASGAAVLTMDAGSEFAEHKSVVLQDIRSVLCVPLQLDLSGVRKDIGVLYLDTRTETKAFTPEDQELLTAFARLAAIAIENARLFTRLQEEERLRDRMGRSLPRAVVQKLIDAGEDWGPGGDEQFVTVLDCDIRGFTTMSERLTPYETIDLLNYYFGEMTQIVFAHEGTLDKFMGDGLMAIFGAPYGRDDDAMRAVQCAVEMVKHMRTINAALGQRHLPALRIGIGLNSGVAIAGNVGSARRMDYTVVGDSVNVACRLQSAARPAEDRDELGAVLVSQATYDLVRERIPADPIGELALKGKEAPLPVYRIRLGDRTAPAAAGARLGGGEDAGA